MKIFKAALFALSLYGLAGAAVASSFALSYAPVAGWFPEQPRHSRASSIAFGEGAASTSEKLDLKGDGFRLTLRTTSFPSPSDASQGYREALAQEPADGARVEFASGGLRGTEVDELHTRSRLMIYQNQLIVATASWSDDSQLPTVTRFLQSLELR